MPNVLNGPPAALPHPRHAHKFERTTPESVAIAPETPEATAPVTEPVEAPTDATPADRSRDHVQQSLHQLDRLVRHEIKARIEAGDLDRETVRSLKALTKDFRFALKDAFHGAGRGGDFDRSLILSGIGEAVTSLTEGLRALRGAEPEVEEIPGGAETPEVAPAPVEKPEVEETMFVSPGGLLETLA